MSALPNPFISNPAASPVVADAAVAMRPPPVPAAAVTISVSPSPDLISEHAKSAVASSDLQPRATAEQIPSSDGGVEGHASEETVSVAVRGLRERRPRDMEAAGSQREAETGWSPEMARVREQASNCTSQDSDRIAGPSAARDRAGVESGPSETIPSNEGRSQEAPASAPTKNPDAGVLAKCNCEYAHCEDFDRPDCRAKAAGLDPWPDGATDHIHEIFAGARKLLPPIDIEEIELPLFIRDGDHLRRWEA